MSLRLRAAAATDVGNIRDNNQDDLLVVDDALFVVADGMGGHVAGEVASREAVDAMRAAYEAPGSTDDLRQAVRAANGAVWQRGSDDPSYRGMGTTVTAVAVIDGDKLAVANVGDSRTYLMRDDELMQLTEDHSFVQEAVRSGQLTRAQAESHPRRSQLTRALGVGDDVEVDVEVVEPLSGDRLLLCSDGLWDEVGDDLIAMVLSGREEPEDAASEPVRWAKEAGGRDNITVIVLDVVDGGEAERAVTASAALDRSGDEQTATSRADAATMVMSAEDEEEGGRAAGSGGTASRAGQGRAGVGTSTASRGGHDGRGAGGSLMHPGSDTSASVHQPRLLTWRVLAFLVVLLGVVGVAAFIVAGAGTAWVVTLDGNTVVMKEGDEIREETVLQVNQLPPDIQLQVRQGQRFENRDEAKRYIDGIALQALQRETLDPPGAGVVVTTAPGGTTVTTAAGTATTAPGGVEGGTPETTFPGG